MIDSHELILQPGLIVNQEFFNYSDMQASAKNWLFFTRYRFGTGEFYGCHDGVQLNNLQFGHADRHEGMMYEGISPKECITIIILQKNSGCVYVNRLKIESENVIIIDDSKPYDFVSSHRAMLAIVSISKSLLSREIPWILSATDKQFKDKNHILSDTIESEWSRILDEPKLFSDANKIGVMENKIVKAIKTSFAGQTGKKCHLTEGEKTAIEVKSFLLNALEETMTIQNITEQFQVSDKTLETSFKSLFGITPKHFIELLKLNHAHKDLQLSDKETTNVSDIATKWGFLHFGRFAKDYKSLFGVLPSETLTLTSMT